MAKAYDYVIVGAGSAGCVLASRLTEDPSTRVLLLEAGGRDLDPFIHIPLGIGMLRKHQLHDWRYQTEPEPNLQGRRLPVPRGKVLGGSSSINLMGYTRGSRADYDRWVQEGALGWSYADVLPYFKRAETAPDHTGEARGRSGPLTVQWSQIADPIDDAWRQAAVAAGYRSEPDLSSGDADGFGSLQYTIRAGRRASTASAYLSPARRRPNLEVRTRSHATRVIMEGRRAIGIEYIGRRGNGEKARAEREVILSAGVFNTTQLLMLSGVGPADHLRQHGIDVVEDLPVGQNLQDHLMIANLYARKQPGELHRNMRADRMAVNMLRAYFFGTGFAASLPLREMAFFRSRPDVAAPDLEVMLQNIPPVAYMWFPGWRKPYEDGFNIRPVLLHPESRGKVTLRSSDPRDPVRMNFNFLSARGDLETLRRGLRISREIASQKPLDAFRGNEVLPGPDVQSDADIDAFIRGNAVHVAHPSCTCPMGSGPEAVLDPELRVRGVERLRVADASAMPSLVSAHINACVIMIGEKAADLVRGKRSASER